MIVFAARAATPHDAGTIELLAREAIEELSAGRGGAVWRRREARQEPIGPGIAAALAASASGGDHHVTMGTVDDTPVGYGIVHREALADGASIARIDDLYVEPEARDVGVGEAIMDLLLAAAEAWGCIGVDAMALPGDRHTKNFFERYGLTARAITVHRTFAPTPTPTPAPG
ncbi:MAG: acetyltransferase family protein [Acidimicrobiales bacterium]|nr:acetyltransferase family protein [Acidimicrobiales bacterium]